MIMIQGTGTISNYGNYISNCTKNQYPYKIPVNALSDVQLYINIGATEPSAVQYQLIHTCGANSGDVDNLTTSSYVVGQDTNLNWYGVFKGFAGSAPVCFVIAITLTIGGTDYIFFSEEYCVENSCNPLTLIKGCYGNLDNKISYDRKGIYFGVPDGDTAMGDITLKYEHKLLLTDVELSLAGIKTTFKKGRTRNFRTEEQDIFQFTGGFVPEWYIWEVQAVFARGEVYIGGVKYLVEQTQFEKIEDCKRIWKIPVTLTESYYQSFSCELDPCAAPPEEPCCDPLGVSASVSFNVCCDPVVLGATVEITGGE